MEKEFDNMNKSQVIEVNKYINVYYQRLKLAFLNSKGGKLRLVLKCFDSNNK